jgi:hypothetical protein
MNERVLIMSGRKNNDVDSEKEIITYREKVYDSYEPTKNKLDDKNPPSEDSDSSDSNSD